MKKFFCSIIFALSLLFTNTSYSQLKQCCVAKKVKIKKGKRRGAGALVGVKGIKDKKVNQSQIKRERKKARKEAKAKAKKEEEEQQQQEDQTIEVNPPLKEEEDN